METETKTAVAWAMWAPSASGGKNYHILLFDKMVIVGWGAVGGTMQYKTEHYASAWTAQAEALIITQKKEKSGYTLTVQPKASHLPASHWEGMLDAYSKMRGSDTYLDTVFNTIFNQGTRLEA